MTDLHAAPNIFAMGAMLGRDVDQLKMPRPDAYFEPSELVEVVFGLNMPSDQQASLRELVAGDYWRHVRFRKAIRSDGFAVRIDDFE